MKNIEVKKNDSISTFEVSINLFKHKKFSFYQIGLCFSTFNDTLSLHFVTNKIFREPRIYIGTFPSRRVSVGYLKHAELSCNSDLGTPSCFDHKLCTFRQNIYGTFKIFPYSLFLRKSKELNHLSCIFFKIVPSFIYIFLPPTVKVLETFLEPVL